MDLTLPAGDTGGLPTVERSWPYTLKTSPCTPWPKKGARLRQEGDSPALWDRCIAMLTSSRPCAGAGYLPYYLYRQKFMSGSLKTWLVNLASSMLIISV